MHGGSMQVFSESDTKMGEPLEREPANSEKLSEHKVPANRLRKSEYEGNKLTKRLRSATGKAIGDFNMIEDGDKVMVCLSGGKDSYTLLDMLLALRENAPIHYEVIAFNLDQKQPGFPPEVLPNYLSSKGVPFHIEEQDTYSIVKRVVPDGKTTCGLCSRLRRGIIYRVAKELGCTKIALGHHRDDILETLFLNMFYGGKMKAMSPKLVSDNGEHVLIRPLAYCREKDLANYAQLKQFPIIPCNLCGSQPDLQRQAIKGMMQTWDKQFPGRLESMFRAVQNIVPSHLADLSLFPFANLSRHTMPEGIEGDIAFDSEPCSTSASLFMEEDEEETIPAKTIHIPISVAG